MLTSTSLDQAGAESIANPDRPVAATAAAFRKSRRPDKCLSAVMTILEVDLEAVSRADAIRARKNKKKRRSSVCAERTGGNRSPEFWLEARGLGFQNTNATPPRTERA